ncbi:hypothetical protein GCM10010390_78140 [Streptomyces mordarskii]|uniref:Uncharacterized protein n=1 Tax=Streptomyces mordarskii TaxID=1226758 RepID=A0ABN1ED20_9ACTN
MPVRATPSLFPHGNWHGARCWTEVIAASAGSAARLSRWTWQGTGCAHAGPPASPAAPSTPRHDTGKLDLLRVTGARTAAPRP